VEKVQPQHVPFNDGFDEAITKPLAELTSSCRRACAPACLTPFPTCDGPSTAINTFFQSKPVEALSDVGVSRSTPRSASLDVLTCHGWGMEAHREDFGQTLWCGGFEPGRIS